jgi:hypothetical protein
VIPQLARDIIAELDRAGFVTCRGHRVSPTGLSHPEGSSTEGTVMTRTESKSWTLTT